MVLIHSCVENHWSGLELDYQKYKWASVISVTVQVLSWDLFSYIALNFVFQWFYLSRVSKSLLYILQMTHACEYRIKHYMK